MAKQNPNSKPIIIVEGYKGGVGKSLVAVTLIEYCRLNNIPLSIVDTDTTNPDIFAIYDGKERCVQIDLDQKDGGGWGELANFAEEHPETLIVSMKAGTKGTTEANQEFFAESVRLLKRPVNLFFVLGIQQQSAVLLSKALDLYPMATVVAVLNQKNGERDEFFNYDHIRQHPEYGKKFEGVIEFFLPRIHASVTLLITDEEKPIKELLEGNEIKIATRSWLQAWFGRISDFYDANRERLGL